MRYRQNYIFDFGRTVWMTSLLLIANDFATKRLYDRNSRVIIVMTRRRSWQTLFGRRTDLHWAGTLSLPTNIRVEHRIV
jgi:hypothetical protein